MRAQAVLAESAKEADLIRRIARTKDRLIRTIPEFRADARSLRKGLRPHRADALEFPGKHTAEEHEEAKRDALHNVEQARPFAARWRLPWMPSANLDHSYLATHPFSQAPLLNGSLDAVTEFGEEHLPLLVLHIDIRLPKRTILQRIDDRLDKAIDAWERAGGRCAMDATRELAKLEKLLAVVARMDRMTKEAIAADLKITPRYVGDLLKLWESVRSGRSVCELAPYTHMAWHDQRLAALTAHLDDISRPNRPIPIQIIS